jgi:hypothetical protein
MSIPWTYVMILKHYCRKSVRVSLPRPTCRACGIDREETGHLFAECPALSQTRFKILGHHTLPLDFQWTPSNLLAMVNAVTERYPEEIPQAQGNNFSQPREPETP